MEDDGKIYRMLQIVGRKFWKQIKIYGTEVKNTMQRIKKKAARFCYSYNVNNLNITIKIIVICTYCTAVSTST